MASNQYDSVGNALVMVTTGGTVTNSYDQANRLTASVTPIGTITFDYDANNRRTQMIDAGGNITTYTWTDDNQLAAITLPNSGGTVTNTYGGDGLRFSRADSSGTNSYLWSGQVLEAQLGNGHTVSTWYTQGVGDGQRATNNEQRTTRSGEFGDIISTRDVAGSATSWPQYDASGNVSQTTDSGAGITTTLAYDTFGVVTDNSGPQNPTVAWQGKQGYQFESTLGPAGLQYVRQRWYDPATRQFISPDPLGFAGGDVNLFRYAGNNPVNRNDPGGMDTINDLTLQNTPLPPVSPPMPPTPLAPRKPSHPIMRHGSIAGHGSTSLLPFENLFHPMQQMPGLGPIDAAVAALAPHFNRRPYDISSLGVSASLAIAVQIHNQDVRMALAGQLNPKMIEGPWGYRFVDLSTSHEPASGAYLAGGLLWSESGVVNGTLLLLGLPGHGSYPSVLIGGTRFNVVARPGMRLQVVTAPNGQVVNIWGQARSSSTTPMHDATIEAGAKELAMTGKYTDVLMQRSWRTATGREAVSSRIPDIIALRKSGEADAWEVQSGSDAMKPLLKRLGEGMETVPEGYRGKSNVIEPGKPLSLPEIP